MGSKTVSETVEYFSLSGSSASLTEKPSLRLIKGELPKSLKPKAIEEAVWCLISEIDVQGNIIGFFNQTVKRIASCTYLDGQGDFWVCIGKDGSIDAYLIGGVTTDIDDSLTYFISQAWASKRVRGKADVKEWWKDVKARARECMCKHILITTARNPKAFCRFLGKQDVHIYGTLLKQDL